MIPTGQSTETAELNELRAEIRSLRAEVAQLRATRGRAPDDRDSGAREIGDSARDVLERGQAEADKLARGILFGYLESVQIVAESAKEFSTRLRDRNRPSHADSLDDLVRRLPRDVTTELLAAVERALDTGRVLDRVRENYDETSELPQHSERTSPKRRTYEASPDIIVQPVSSTGGSSSI